MTKNISELLDEYDPPMVEITAEDLGTLIFCAISYDRRLRAAHTPPRLWEKLPQEWRDRINKGTSDHRWEERPR